MAGRQTKAPVILWFRKDLRLADNHALDQAASKGRAIVATFIMEPDEQGTGALGAAQKWWLHHSLIALQGSLSAKKVPLLLYRGDAQEVLSTLVTATGADAVYVNRRFDPPGQAVDRNVEAHLTKAGITFQQFEGQLLHDPQRLLTGGKTSFKVFTAFWNAFQKSIDPPVPASAPQDLNAAKTVPAGEALEDWNLLPVKPDWAADFKELWTPGEEAAKEALNDFMQALNGYKEGRDFPARRATSMLSPHLAMGEISPAQLWEATRHVPKRTSSAEVTHLRRELVWREFCYHLLYHFPALPDAPLNSRFQTFQWQSDKQCFHRWSHGMTGYPIVDAGMRQLWKFGWMHNRVRMITASFLIKDLLIDWREGEAWFRDTLVDVDPANNAANWQWVAGCGADASPFFRVFNPVLQGQKFDPEGEYIREHAPELAKLPKKYIHRPFEAPAEVLKAAAIILGETYPEPIVDHAKARDRALAAFRTLKGGN